MGIGVKRAGQKRLSVEAQILPRRNAVPQLRCLQIFRYDSQPLRAGLSCGAPTALRGKKRKREFGGGRGARSRRYKGKRCGLEGAAGLGGFEVLDAAGEEGLLGEFFDEDDLGGDEDGGLAGLVGNGDFNEGPHIVLLAAREAQAAFGHVLAGDDVVCALGIANAGGVVDLDARVLAAVDASGGRSFLDWGGQGEGGGVRAGGQGRDKGQGGARGGCPERSGSTAFARAEDAIVGGADVGFDAGVVDFFESAAGAAAEGGEAELLFDIADGRKIDFPEIEILVEEGRAVGVETGLFADLADDADVGFLVFFGPAEDELLFRGKFVAGENARTAEGEDGRKGAVGKTAGGPNRS